mgnify:FL=1
MHIVYVCREYPPTLRGGGIATYIRLIAQGLVERNNKVTVICASDDTRISSDYSDRGVRVIRLSGGDFILPSVESTSLLKKFRFIYRFDSYRKKIREAILELDDIDIIEVADFGAESYFLKDINAPVVVRLHTPSLFDRTTLGIKKYQGKDKLFQFIGEREKYILKHADFLSSCSESLKDWTIQNLGIDSNKIEVIYNPIELPTQIVELKSSTVKPTIVFVGTISDVKGCADLFEAGKILAEKNVDFDMFLYGKIGEFAENLKMNEQSYPWFHVIGKIEREKLFSIYCNASVVCFPSWWDNMPMVCLEAMGVGAVVLGSSSGGMSEIIQDSINGYLIEPHNVNLLAEKLQFLINLDSKTKRQISDNAEKRIENDFSLRTIVDKTIDYYNRVINKFENENTIC